MLDVFRLSANTWISNRLRARYRAWYDGHLNGYKSETFDRNTTKPDLRPGIFPMQLEEIYWKWAVFFSVVELTKVHNGATKEKMRVWGSLE